MATICYRYLAYISGSPLGLAQNHPQGAEARHGRSLWWSSLGDISHFGRARNILLGQGGARKGRTNVGFHSFWAGQQNLCAAPTIWKVIWVAKKYRLFQHMTRRWVAFKNIGNVILCYPGPTEIQLIEIDGIRLSILLILKNAVNVRVHKMWFAFLIHENIVIY